MKFKLVLLFTLLTTISIIAQDIQGTWNGVLALPGQELKLVFHITKSDDVYQSKLDSPVQGAFGIETSSTTFTNSELKIEIASLGASYAGKLNDDKTIVGSFTQGGQSFPLNLSKGEIKKESLNRPQEPKEPYPYLTEDLKFENTKDNVQLAGTLTLPGDDGVYPAVILISGSGPQNRNEKLFGHKPFLVLADYLTKKGFAVLRYDDRGVGESTGDFNTATTFDFANDVEAAINYLKLRKEIDKEKIGLIGHSEGGVIAPILATQNSDVAFLIMLAGSAMRGDNLLLLQKYKVEIAMGVNSMVVESNNKIFRGAYDIILDETIDSQKLYDLVKDYFKSNYGAALQESQLIPICKQLTSTWWVTFFRTDPADYLKKVTCPVFALYGSKDLQVPSTENIKVLEEIKKSSEKENIKIIELQNLNHLFQECETGLGTEHEKIEQTISPIALEEIGNWLTEQVK